MNCERCGNRVPDGAQFCGQCGRRLAARPYPADATDSTRVYLQGGEAGRTRVMPGTNMGRARQYLADIGFVFDLTASMGPFIRGLKDMVIQFSRDLEDRHIDCRLGLVGYRDLKIGEEMKVYGFAESAEHFRGWVSGLKDEGGGDEPESAIDALYAGMGMDFRPGAVKIMTLITDASCHDPGENGRTMNDVIREVRERKIVTYVIGPELRGYLSLADAMGGMFFNISRDPNVFRRILKSLGKTISETVPRLNDMRKAVDAALDRTRVR